MILRNAFRLGVHFFIMICFPLLKLMDTLIDTKFRSNRSIFDSDINAGEMLEEGEQPVNQVINDMKKLPDGKIYKLKVPFVSAPIIDKATSLNFRHWVDKKSTEKVDVYFFKD